MLTYNLSSRQNEPKYIYLYKLIRQDIINQRISPGDKLPSKRALAEHNGVSVITVEYAYRCLEDEGYIYSKERSGWFVGELDSVFTPKNDMSEKEKNQPDEQISHDNNFPLATYSKIARRVLSQYGEQIITKSPHNGSIVLRQAISDYLFRYRGITASPQNIVIGSGAEYLYSMIVQLFGRDKLYGIENPSYEKIRKVYEANGATCELLELDKFGIKSNVLSSTKANIIHVTPYKSYPTGITAPASKRFEYLSWAEKSGGIIIEDDFSSEFALNTKNVETIYSMDKNDCVIYLNTFSKSLTPSIRIGYMLLPPKISETYNQKLGFYSCTVPVFDQYVLAEFINEGAFERHLNRIRRKIKS